MLDNQLLKTQIENFYQDILINLDTEKIEHYFAAEYIQETEHDTLNLTEFKLHLQKLKEVVNTLLKSMRYLNLMSLVKSLHVVS